MKTVKLLEGNRLSIPKEVVENLHILKGALFIVEHDNHAKTITYQLAKTVPVTEE